ncbi:MAG: DUF2726 domain-containing protein [Nitrospira sp.]|nr:DUF2726 domain-containing protein [Nitrospira sp.]MDE0406040.1 DUF2726 domain-containing protein [Nitrospira sp.]MDE0485743.1 DUF2726 domain-containing protein [Nitrospira sp.]
MNLFESFLERLLAWLPFATHPVLSQVLGLVLIVVVVLVVVTLWFWRRSPKFVPAPGARIDGLGNQVSAMARPLMDGSDVSMFNLLLMAVREHFLLLSKIPLRSLMHLRVEDDSIKRALAQTLRNVTVDFVAVHPGTRLPVKAIFLTKPEDDVMASSSQDRLVEALLRKAGIDVLRLDPEVLYSVERLTNLLGLEEDT